MWDSTQRWDYCMKLLFSVFFFLPPLEQTPRPPKCKMSVLVGHFWIAAFTFHQWTGNRTGLGLRHRCWRSLCWAEGSFTSLQLLNKLSREETHCSVGVPVASLTSMGIFIYGHHIAFVLTFQCAVYRHKYIQYVYVKHLCNVFPWPSSLLGSPHLSHFLEEADYDWCL